MKIDRVLPIVIAGLGVVAASIGVAVADSLVIGVGAVVAGATVFGVGYLRYHRQWDRADEVRIDERVEMTVSRLGERASRISLGLAMVLDAVVEAGRVPITAEEGFVLLSLSMVVARFGTYGWYSRPAA